MTRLKCCKCGIKKWSNYECKCGKIVCLNHKYSYAHDCTLDVKKVWALQLEEKIPKIKTPKVIPI